MRSIRYVCVWGKEGGHFERTLCQNKHVLIHQQSLCIRVENFSECPFIFFSLFSAIVVTALDVITAQNVLYENWKLQKHQRTLELKSTFTTSYELISLHKLYLATQLVAEKIHSTQNTYAKKNKHAYDKHRQNYREHYTD